MCGGGGSSAARDVALFKGKKGEPHVSDMTKHVKSCDVPSLIHVMVTAQKVLHVPPIASEDGPVFSGRLRKQSRNMLSAMGIGSC